MLIFVLFSLFSSMSNPAYAKDFSNPVTVYQINVNDNLKIFSPIDGNAPAQQIQFEQIATKCNLSKVMKVYKNHYDKREYRRFSCDTHDYAIKNEDYLVAQKVQDIHNQTKAPTKTPRLPDDSKSMIRLVGNLKLTLVIKSNDQGNYAFSSQKAPIILTKHAPFKIVSTLNGLKNRKYFVVTIPSTNQEQEYVVPEDEFDRAIKSMDKIYAPIIAHPVRRKNTTGISYEYAKDVNTIIIPADTVVKTGASLENGKYLVLNSENSYHTEYVVLRSAYEKSLQSMTVIDKPLTVSPVIRKDDSYSFTDQDDNVTLPKNSTLIIKEIIKMNSFQNYLVLSVPDRPGDFIISEDELNETLLSTKAPPPPKAAAPIVTIYADKSKVTGYSTIAFITKLKEKIKFTLRKKNKYEKYPILRDGSNLKLTIPPAPRGPYQAINDTASNVNSSLNKVSKLYYKLLQDTVPKRSALLASINTDDLLKTPYGRCVSTTIKNPPGAWEFFYCDSATAKPIFDHKRPSFTKELRATIAAELIMIHKCLPLQEMEMLPVFFHESRFMPNASSSQDAIGIGQIRPAAIKDVEKEMIPILGNLINHNIPGCQYLLNLKRDSSTNYQSAKSCAQQFNPYYIRQSIVYSSLYYLHVKEKAIKRVNERFTGVEPSSDIINTCIMNDARLCYNTGPTAVNQLHKYLIQAKMVPEEQSSEGNHRDYYERVKSEEAAQYVPKQLEDQSLMEKTAQTTCGPHPKN